MKNELKVLTLLALFSGAVCGVLSYSDESEARKFPPRGTGIVSVFPDFSTIVDLTIPPDLTSGGSLTVLHVEEFDSQTASFTRTFTPANAVMAGSAIVLVMRHESTVTAISDTGTNSWAHPVNNATGGQTLDAFVESNASSGTPTITFTVADFYKSIGGVYFEIGGANTTTATESSASDNASSTSSDWYSGSVTAASAAVVIGWWVTYNDALTDPPYGWTADATWSKKNYVGKWIDSGATYKVVTAGSYTPHVTPNSGYSTHLGSSIAIH